jgi:carboxymethylenebutenolidase
MGEQKTIDGLPIYQSGSSTSSRALVIIQEAFGVNFHIRNVSDEFSASGYFVVAPFLFHRIGSPEISYNDLPTAVQAMGTLNKENLSADVSAAISYLSSLGFRKENIGVVGYCMGGTVAFCAATFGTLGAAVSFYGAGITQSRFGFDPLIELTPTLKCPWLGLYGERDKTISIEDIKQLEAALPKSPFSAQLVRYPEAEHAFDCTPRPEVFNQASSTDARRRTLQFLDDHLEALS